VSHLVCCKVGAHTSNAATAEREADSHRSLVASHPQDPACNTGSADLSDLTLQSSQLTHIIKFCL